MAYTSCPYLAVCMEATDALSPCGPRWRLFGVLAVGGLVAWLLVRSRGQLVAASTAVRSASLVALVGCLFAIVACSANLAALEWRTQRLVGVERSFHETWRLTLGAHALDMASKSGGLVRRDQVRGRRPRTRPVPRARRRRLHPRRSSVSCRAVWGSPRCRWARPCTPSVSTPVTPLAAIAVYRLFDLWLPLTIGLASLRPAMTPGGN